MRLCPFFLAAYRRSCLAPVEGWPARHECGATDKQRAVTMDGSMDGDGAGRMRCRGIRGATTVEENSREAILSATRELLTLMVARNDLNIDEISSIFFTVSDDLDAEHPALAARQLGWTDLALLCAREIPVPGGMPRCVRVLLHVNTTKSQKELRHVYLRAAMALRPGWADDAVSSGERQVRESVAENVNQNGQGGDR